MSLLEDVLHVLRMVLEYFGVPPEMLVPAWDCDLCGQYRSIVRMIGTNIPLSPPPRVHFQIPLISHKPHDNVNATMNTPSVPSFADIVWVCEDEGDGSAKNRNYVQLKNSTANRSTARPWQPLLPQTQRGFSSSKSNRDSDALSKISALETELLKLRAQIAMIVTTPPGSEDAPMTSTPIRQPPPAPPPPPPPPCPTTVPVQSVSELIKSRKQNPAEKAQGGIGSEVKALPSMLDVLKDLNQVKLRSVLRSPGGSPIRRRRSKGAASLHSDPAALIAEALKKKFSQHYHNNSSDKENSREFSPFSSPETPKVPIHNRRSQRYT